MTYEQIEKEFDECEHLETGMCDMDVAKSFLKQSFIKYLQSEVERLEGILKPIQDKEDQHRKEFDIDAERYKYNPSEKNLAVMKMHEGSTSAYCGGLAWGKIQAISDQITHLQAQIKEFEV